VRRPSSLPQPSERYDFRWAANLIRTLDLFFASLSGDLEAVSELISSAGRTINMVTVTDATYTVRTGDDVVDVNRAGVVTVTLPEVTMIKAGKRFYVQDSSGGASGNTITIASPGGVNINGGASVTLTTDYGRKLIIYNGTQYISE